MTHDYVSEPVRTEGRLYLTTDTEFVVESPVALGPIDERNGPGDHVIQTRNRAGEWVDLRPVEEGEKLVVYPGAVLRLRPVEADRDLQHEIQRKVVLGGAVIGRERRA